MRRLSPITGADLGGLNVNGISGGTFAANMIGVGGDGAIYVGNLSTAANSNFKVSAGPTPPPPPPSPTTPPPVPPAWAIPSPSVAPDPTPVSS